jgi:aspartyl protease family protein
MSRVWLIVAIGVAALGALLYWLAGERPGALQSQGDQARFVYLLLLLVLVASSLLVRWRARPAMSWLRHGMIWLSLGLLLVVGYSFRFELDGLWTRLRAELMPGRAIETQAGTVIVSAADDRHFYVDATVDGSPLRLLVDTGASSVVLTEEDARRIGFDLDRLRYTIRTETANGSGFGAPVRLREVRIESIVVRDVPALVNKAPMPASLLGMSFLGRLSGYTVRNGTLTLVR